MANREELKQKIFGVIEGKRAEIEAIGDRIMENPELGFKEFKTAGLVSEAMTRCGISHRSGLAITGVKGVLRGKRPGPTLALIGELDSIRVPEHPSADPKTGAAHACGHNAQIAGLIGAMMGLSKSGAADHMAGNVVFFAVPAEEYVEVEYRLGLVKEGKLTYLGGKPELIHLGHFDDIDISVMIHTHSVPEMKKAAVAESSNGFLSKLVRFVGLAAHAGALPHQGVNALYAAQIALSAINAQRETFKDEDHIRVHPIITKGGDLVNVIPAEVRMETYVRGRSSDAIMDANTKVDRALRAGALALGAKVEIETLPGFMPLRNDPGLKDIFLKNAKALFGEAECCEVGHRTGSTDMGDISHIMPALHPWMSGAEGPGHSARYRIADKEMSYMAPAKALAAMAVDLLFKDADRAKAIIDTHRPAMTKEAYLAFQQSVFGREIYDGRTGKSSDS
jgi:amidohydrolase